MDAYLTPVLQEYIQSFRRGFDENFDRLSVMFMQSDGGLCSIGNFVGCRAILSGPAGGVVGYSQTGKSPLIGFDMGGTSTDVSRYDGQLSHVFETEISGVQLQGAHLDITTVAAGGGSRLFYRSGLYMVGPESSGAHPGPLCYRKGGLLSLTDANLVLGRLLPDFFPKIFGEGKDQPLDYEAAFGGLKEVTDEINESEGKSLSVAEVAMGFVRVANESMCRPIRAITSGKGHDPSLHTLSCFGGAGGQHACAIARSLGIKEISVHKYSGILSAYGLGLADIVEELHHPTALVINETHEILQAIHTIIEELSGKIRIKLKEQGSDEVECQSFLHMRFSGSDTCIPIEFSGDLNSCVSDFNEKYLKEFGFLMKNRDIVIESIRVRGVAKASPLEPSNIVHHTSASNSTLAQVFFETPEGLQSLSTPVFTLDSLAPGTEIPGPALIISNISCIVIEPQCTATITPTQNVEILLHTLPKASTSVTTCDNVLLSLFAHRFMSIAEQMGRTLQRTAISTNIKERLDYSCAIFGSDGSLVANAPHLPVHLGSMQEAVKKQIELVPDWKAGEVLLSNHPCAGGSHLPDMTVITPVFHNNSKVFFVASRGHHADIGGITPGSMPPFSKYLSEEGVAIYSCKIVEDSVFQESRIRDLFRSSRCIEDNVSDLSAQSSANNKGISLLQELIEEYSIDVVQAYMKYIQQAAGDCVRTLLEKVPNNILTAHDYMDNGTKINLKISIDQGRAEFDFSGTGFQELSNLNTPEAVVKSAVLYCLRCMVDTDIPLNQGCLDPITIKIPRGSILSPSPEAAVVGGNVQTSQRITDVIFKAFGACAASQGCMNNLTFGNERFGFYETIGGGSGAGNGFRGESAVHTHMTNTRITDIEIMERRYPVMVTEFSIRADSGGQGRWSGGDGIVREILFLEDMEVGILSERRSRKPFGLEGGKHGRRGENFIIRSDGAVISIGGKCQCKVGKGDRIRILTPGGGGYGNIVRDL